MKAVCLIILLTPAAVALSVAEPQDNPGQEQSNQGAGKVLDLAPNKVLDLVFRVEDMGGKVQSGAMKQSVGEMRMALSADVHIQFSIWTRPVSCLETTTS